MKRVIISLVISGCVSGNCLASPLEPSKDKFSITYHEIEKTKRKTIVRKVAYVVAVSSVAGAATAAYFFVSGFADFVKSGAKLFLNKGFEIWNSAEGYLRNSKKEPIENLAFQELATSANSENNRSVPARIYWNGVVNAAQYGGLLGAFLGLYCYK